MSYSALDRTLARLAFRSVEIQKDLADLEDRMFATRIAMIDIERPVFITSLARCGTTLLLETLGAAPQFESHSYRDMPFLLNPMLWDGITRRFRKQAELHERAHGDGMLVGYDSAEAFEEVLWKAFWSKRYGKSRIELWSEADNYPAFERFFRGHIRKIIAIRTAAAQPRYLSKNNGNIARVGYLRKLFPDATILVPFRSPMAHAESLLEQHRNFAQQQIADRFTEEYMNYLGHHEFGLGLKPIGFSLASGPHDPDTLEYWLEYWCGTFGWLLSQTAAKLSFVSYDQLCATPEAVTERLMKVCGVSPAPAGVGVREARRGEPRPPANALEERASMLHAALLANAL